MQVLIVEDEELFARAVLKRLTKEGYQCHHANTLERASAYCKDNQPDLILLDMRLPDGSGLDFLAKLRNGLGPEVPVLVLSAYGELEDAVAAMKLNALDYLKKPIDLDELVVNVQKVLSKAELTRSLVYSRKRERSAKAENPGQFFLGDCEPIRDFRRQAERIGALVATPDVVPPTVLIQGETGTGKDVAARLLHSLSARRDRPFVHMDCAALPKDLIEAELFGHEKGAFTSAHVERTGLIEAAEDGTLFLDEIGEIPPELQVKLLAVLERRTLRRVGSTHERPVRCWFIAATNRDMETMVKEGRLRSDLYFRLNVLTIKMPPLRDRGDDILLLAREFAKQTAARYGRREPQFEPEALEALRRYHWPGNVRELRHLIERVVLLSGGGPIKAATLMLSTPAATTPSVDAALDGMSLEAAEKLLIERALKRTNNNVSEAARQLGITRMIMRTRMKKYGFA
ncbi:MAG TPA: sigma-54 dependent transcriptional regulator [Gammaproteobacteria bacterium]|nr:sigma-54 dependent transcriptional regulator [Gammaproteobacteria bacterium]